MKGKSPMMKALIGDQKNLNDGLKAAIQDSPATMKKESPAKQDKMSLTFVKTNKKTGETTTNNNKFKSNNSLVGKKTTSDLLKNFLVPIGKGTKNNSGEWKNAKNNLKPAVGKMKKESMAKMKKAPAKMKKESMAKMKKSPAKAGQTAGQIMRRERLMN